MAAATAASTAVEVAAEGLSSLVSVVSTIYSAIGSRKLGKADLYWYIGDWLAHMSYTRTIITQGLLHATTRARTMYVLDLHVNLATWLANCGFQLANVKARQYLSVRSWRFPRWYLDRKASGFQVKLAMIKTEATSLGADVEKAEAQPTPRTTEDIDPAIVEKLGHKFSVAHTKLAGGTIASATTKQEATSKVPRLSVTM